MASSPFLRRIVLDAKRVAVTELDKNTQELSNTEWQPVVCEILLGLQNWFGIPRKIFAWYRFKSCTLQLEYVIA